MSLLFKYKFDRCYSLHLEETRNQIEINYSVRLQT